MAGKLAKKMGWWVHRTTLLAKLKLQGRASQIPSPTQISKLWEEYYDTELACDPESNIHDYSDQVKDGVELAIYAPKRKGQGTASLEPGAERIDTLFKHTLTSMSGAMDKYVKVLGGGSAKKPTLRASI